MPKAYWFWLAFCTTVVLLATALVSGLRGRRRLHLWAGPLAMATLVVAIVCTEQLMAAYVFPPRMLAVHLVIAKTAGLLALPVILTGVWLWRRPQARRWHRYAVFTFVAATAVTTASGVWMFLHGDAR